MGNRDDHTVDLLLHDARPADVLQRREVLADVEQRLFGRSRIRHPFAFGRFVVLEKLGSGGGGLVHAAYDPELHRRVAIKLMAPGRADDPDVARQRLLREAQAIASLSHPNVLAIYDVGTFDDDEARELGVAGAGVYLVMELVDGSDLRAWLLESRPPLRRILDVFIDVAKGIAAAHEKGIIHRDIKPSNIMIGADGRPRVLDFGLARKLGTPSQPSPAEATPTPALEQSITAHGIVMGTPAYMAPEQHSAADTDERTDQYAFCVTLYEAVYGERPFSADSVEALVTAKKSGKLPTPPDGRSVPRWVRDVVARGLAADPSHRHADMRAVISALQNDPSRRFKRRAVVAAAIAVVGMSGASAYRARAERSRACDVTEELAGIWDADSRSRLAQAFAASTLPHADATWTRVERKLDRWVASWTEAWQTSCRATVVEGSHTVGDMGRTALCLERRLEHVGGTVRVLLRADDAVIDRAERIVETLPDLRPCTVRSPTTDDVDLRDPDQRGRVLDVEGTLAEAEALWEAGRFDEASDLGRAALESSRATDDARLQALALSVLGGIAQDRIRTSEAERLLRASILAAERADDELQTIATSLTLAFGLGVLQARPEEALHLIDQCEARLDKHGDLPRIGARIAYIRGRVLEARGDHEDALRAFEQALSLYERALGPEDARTVAVLNNVGVAHDRLGQYEDALRYYERTLAARRARHGDDHPETANALGNVGAAYVNLGRHAEAIEPLRRSIATYTAAFGDEHNLVAWYRVSLGMALRSLGRHQEGLIELEAAVRIAATVLGDGHPHTATARTELAETLIDLGRGEEALAVADRAVSRLADWPDRPLLANARHARARALHRLGHPRIEVERELREAIVMLEAAVGRNHVDTTDARLTLANAAREWGDWKLAHEQAARAVEILEAAQVGEARRQPARLLLAELGEPR